MCWRDDYRPNWYWDLWKPKSNSTTNEEPIITKVKCKIYGQECCPEEGKYCNKRCTIDEPF